MESTLTETTISLPAVIAHLTATGRDMIGSGVLAVSVGVDALLAAVL